jgi:hypothetical protein
VIIGAVLEGPIVGAVVGLIFGVFSMIRAAVAPNSPLDPAFTNPLISVLPRLFIGPVAWLVWKALKRWTAVGLVAAGVAGSVTNTVLVLSMIALVPSALGILRGLLQQPNTPKMERVRVAEGAMKSRLFPLTATMGTPALWSDRLFGPIQTATGMVIPGPLPRPVRSRLDMPQIMGTATTVMPMSNRARRDFSERLTPEATGITIATGVS